MDTSLKQRTGLPDHNWSDEMKVSAWSKQEHGEMFGFDAIYEASLCDLLHLLHFAACIFQPPSPPRAIPLRMISTNGP